MGIKSCRNHIDWWCVGSYQLWISGDDIYSKYYKTFSNILQIRTISAEYLVAMKLMAGRQYKNDLSDVVGILVEQEDRGEQLPFEIIKTAIEDLYESYDAVPENKDILVEFQDDYPGVLNDDNLSDILRAAREKKNKNLLC